MSRTLYLAMHGVRIRVRRGRRPRWDAARRIAVAMANDNGGTWWVVAARRGRSVADIERKFYEGSIARVLYAAVGGVLGDHKALGGGERGTASHYLYVQLAQADADVVHCLREIGLELVNPIDFADIRHP